MKIKAWLAAIAVAAGAGVPGAVFAQPVTKLVDGVDQDTVAIMWCSAVLFEESFWYDEGDSRGDYYDDVSLELEHMAVEVMEAKGWSQDRQDALWETYDSAAFELAEAEDGRFLDLVDTCEGDFGHLATPPGK